MRRCIGWIQHLSAADPTFDEVYRLTTVDAQMNLARLLNRAGRSLDDQGSTTRPSRSSPTLRRCSTKSPGSW